MMNKRALERFESKVRMTSYCWQWLGKPDSSNGYGIFELDGKKMLPHRIAWTMNFGPIPEGLFVCHACDNKLCVNPHHLLLGTNAANGMIRNKSVMHQGPKGKAYCNHCLRKLESKPLVGCPHKAHAIAYDSYLAQKRRSYHRKVNPID